MRVNFSSGSLAETEGLLAVNRGRYRTNEVVGTRVYFSSDSIAEIEGLLDVNRDFCEKKMAEKAPRDVPPNCAVLPEVFAR